LGMAQAGADFVALWPLQCAFNLSFEIRRNGRCKDVPLLRLGAGLSCLFYSLLFFLGQLAWRVGRLLCYVLFLLSRNIVVDPALKLLDCTVVAILRNRAWEQQDGEKA